jgi:hypothetical protein
VDDVPPLTDDNSRLRGVAPLLGDELALHGRTKIVDVVESRSHALVPTADVL